MVEMKEMKTLLLNNTKYEIVDAASRNDISMLKSVNNELLTKIDGKQPLGNYLTDEIDPTVPSWAKQENKPVYTYDEVGADKSGAAEEKVNIHNASENSHTDIRNLIIDINNKINNIVIPEKLPNPEKLIFNGAVTGEYDGTGLLTITIDEGIQIDETFGVSGQAADSKLTGDAIETLTNNINNINLSIAEIENLKNEIENLKLEIKSIKSNNTETV